MIKTFQAKKFELPELIGISKKNIEEHIKLYEGYVNNLNLIIKKVDEYRSDTEKNSYAINELTRRFSFEWNGMKNHEIYFTHFEGGPTVPNENSKLHAIIKERWGSFDTWFNEFKVLATTRSIGWAMLSYDKSTNTIHNSWVDEQHLGQLNGCTTILALDMWEHSYVSDYFPSGKKNYIEDFFKNINWQTIEANFERAL